MFQGRWKCKEGEGGQVGHAFCFRKSTLYSLYYKSITETVPTNFYFLSTTNRVIVYIIVSSFKKKKKLGFNGVNLWDTGYSEKLRGAPAGLQY